MNHANYYPPFVYLCTQIVEYMNRIIKFAKEWTLLCSLIVGTFFYLLFSRIEVLEPVGDSVGPVLQGLLPYVIFVMLYITFTKIQLREFRPHTWHFVLQIIRTLLSALVVLIIAYVSNPEARLIWEGIFICVICPTAAAAPVITDKLGGNIASMTVYMIIANCFTCVIIPLFFPMVEKGANITFALAFWRVLQRVLMVLVLPLCLAMLTRRFLPKVVSWLRQRPNIPFYLWSFNLSIVMGLTVKMLTTTRLHGTTLVLLFVLPLLVCFVLFGIGKLVGGAFGDSIDGGQALGQKNTVVGIWLMLSFLNPTAVIAPCAYVIWQNIVNAVQLWYKDKYGYLRW